VYAIITSAMANVVRTRRNCLSFSHSVCMLCILLYLVIMIGRRYTNRKNLLTSGGDPVPDTVSGSLLLFTRHCGIRDSLRDLLAFLTLTLTMTFTIQYS